MSNYVALRRGKLRVVYNVCQHAGNHGEATKVRFSPRDYWVGDDYWRFVEEYKPFRKERAFSLMSRLEYEKKTDLLRYQIARAIVLIEMGHKGAALFNLHNWMKARYVTDDHV